MKVCTIVGNRPQFIKEAPVMFIMSEVFEATHRDRRRLRCRCISGNFKNE